jgi:endonuclease-3
MMRGKDKNMATGEYMAAEECSKNVLEILDLLEKRYPDAACALDHQNPFQLLVATVLSAQTTDKSVNRVTCRLFEAYPTPKELAGGNPEEVENIIRTIGMYRTKARNIIGLSRELVIRYQGKVPGVYEELISLPGVGRKTANVVLSVAFGEQRIAVDTHVFRVANRIGLAQAKDVLTTEIQLMEIVPRERWSRTHHSLIFHGRDLCEARNPQCQLCPILKYCQYHLSKEGKNK